MEAMSHAPNFDEPGEIHGYLLGGELPTARKWIITPVISVE